VDKLKALATFVRIAEEGSLTRAAQGLASSLPAVVRSLAALEAHLGVRLFHRTTRRITLTEEGRRYLLSARDVLAAVDAADLALTAAAVEPTGLLTVAAPVLFGHMYVAPAIVRFMRSHDRVRCNVLLNDRMVNLLEEGIDVGIRIGALEDSSLVAQSLGTVRRVVVASPDFLKTQGVPHHPRELNGAWCVHGRVDAPSQWEFHEQGQALHVAVQSRLAFNHIAPAIESCAAGMGYGMFLSYQVMPLVEQGRLRLVLEPYEPPPSPVHVVYPHARLLPARTRCFVDWIKAEFRGLRL
jgi:DNA-binding transcriptional LysR family regulator